MKLFVSIILFFVIINTSTMISAESVLHYLVREPKIKSDKSPLIILLHGYGSNEKDLFSFADQLPDNFLVVSVRAPYILRKDSYAWFQVDFSTGKPVINKDEVEKSRLLLLQFMEQLKTQFKLDDTQIYFCGFSQGAIMSYSVGLTNPGRVKGIAILSGRLLEEVKPLIAPDEKLKALKIFIAHGKKDNTLVIDYAREARSYLEQLGLKPVYKEYDEGHSISAATLVDMIAWLK
jgi:phospholipase/carboxylesterase